MMSYYRDSDYRSNQVVSDLNAQEGLTVIVADDDADGGSDGDRYASFYQGWQVRSRKVYPLKLAVQ